MANDLDQAAAATGLDETSDLPAPPDSRWSFINGWQVEPQSNDRKPVDSAVVPNSANASVARSMTRRRHQAKFKEWSQDRHE